MLHDFLTAHPSFYMPHADWAYTAQRREAALAERNAALVDPNNRSVHSLPRVMLDVNIWSIDVEMSLISIYDFYILCRYEYVHETSYDMVFQGTYP